MELKSAFYGGDKLVNRVRSLKKKRKLANYYTDTPKLSLILLSFNHRMNIRKISRRLHNTSADELIICEDGSIDGSDRLWLQKLTRSNDFLIRSNDIHEIRAYNRAIDLARGELVCVLQDDDIPPPSGTWIDEALALFERYPALGILGAYQGYMFDFEGAVKSLARKIIGQWSAEIGKLPYVPVIPFSGSRFANTLYVC